MKPADTHRYGQMLQENTQSMCKHNVTQHVRDNYPSWGGRGWRGWAEEVECGRRGGRSSGGDLRGSRRGGGLDREIVVHEWCLGFRV